MAKQLKRYDLLLREVQDPHAQENFWRLRRILDDLGSSGISGPQGPQGDQGPAGADASLTVSVILPASTTTDVDAAVLNSVNCYQYEICLKEQGGNKRKTFNLLVANSSTGLQDQVFGRCGDGMNVDVSAVSVGPTYFLRFVNSESYNVILEYSRRV